METVSEISYRYPQSTATQQGWRIISHNAFWFQAYPFATDTPPAPRPDIVEQLCSLYNQLSPEIICLQEIQNEATAQLVAEKLKMEYIFCAGGGCPQYGNAVFSHWPIQELPLQYGIVPDRTLLRVKIHLTENDTLNLANIHLPSNRQRGASGGQERRLEELSHVLGQADILLGDFNEFPNGQCTSLLEAAGYIDTAEACQAGTTPSNIAGKRGDHVWVIKDKIDMLQSYFYIPQEQLTLADPEKKFLSDHLPVGCLFHSL